MSQRQWFHTIIINEEPNLVEFGPSPAGGYVVIQGLTAPEFTLLLALAKNRHRGITAHDVGLELRRSSGNDLQWLRGIVCDARKRFRFSVPSENPSMIIQTRRGDGMYVFGEGFIVQRVQGRAIGAAEQGTGRAHDFIVHAIKRATVEQFGHAGLDRAIQELKSETRVNTVDVAVDVGRWVPARYVLDWYLAVFHGAAKFDAASYDRFLERVAHHRLSIAYVEYSQCLHSRFLNIRPMWRKAYDSGVLEAAWVDGAIEARLSDHLYCENEFGRRTFGFSALACAKELGVRNPVLERYELDDRTGALLLRIRGELPSDVA